MALPQLLSCPPCLSQGLLDLSDPHCLCMVCPDLGLLPCPLSPAFTLLGTPFLCLAWKLLSPSHSREFQKLDCVWFPPWDTTVTTCLTPQRPASATAPPLSFSFLPHPCASSLCLGEAAPTCHLQVLTFRLLAVALWPHRTCACAWSHIDPCSNTSFALSSSVGLGK